MTRRDRILTALSGEVPDRPPIAFDSHGEALTEVLAHYGAADRDELYTAAGIDGFSVWDWNAVMGRCTTLARVPQDERSCDFWGNCPQRAYGLSRCNSIADLDAHPWPRIQSFDFSHVLRQARAIKARDMVVAAGHLGLGYQMHNMLRGNEKALFDVTNPEYMDCLVAHVTRFTCDYIAALLEAGAGEIDVVRADDDLGTMERLMISPTMWRRYYKPAWKRAFDIVHAHGAKVWFHSCGHIRPLLEDLVEIGVDCWNPFPDYVAGNDHAWLREWRRGKLALDGGVSHLVLVRGSTNDVVAETRRVLETFAPDGGLLIGPSQVFTEDMPAANIIAFLETARHYQN